MNAFDNQNTMQTPRQTNPNEGVPPSNSPQGSPAGMFEGGKIVKTEVCEDQRLDFLPWKLPNGFFSFENLVYSYMDHLCEEYDGGYWDFYDLSNGGFFMALHTEDDSMMIRGLDNGYEAAMSPEAAGVVVTLYALSHMLNDPRFTKEEESETRLHDHYWRLREFADQHLESRKIRGAID